MPQYAPQNQRITGFPLIESGLNWPPPYWAFARSRTAWRVSPADAWVVGGAVVGAAVVGAGVVGGAVVGAGVVGGWVCGGAVEGGAAVDVVAPSVVGGAVVGPALLDGALSTAVVELDEGPATVSSVSPAADGAACPSTATETTGFAAATDASGAAASWPSAPAASPPDEAAAGSVLSAAVRNGSTSEPLQAAKTIPADAANAGIRLVRTGVTLLQMAILGHDCLGEFHHPPNVAPTPWIPASFVVRRRSTTADWAIPFRIY